MIHHWVLLNGEAKGNFRVLMKPQSQLNANEIFGEEENDHKILHAALSLKQSEKERNVILVSKDINLRLKAKSLGTTSEDYEIGKIKDISHLESTGKQVIKRSGSFFDQPTLHLVHFAGWIDFWGR